MKIVFNDATDLQIQWYSESNGQLQIRTVSAKREVLKQKFMDTLATKKMVVQERERVLAILEDYTILYRLEEYTGGILGVMMYQEQKTPEAQAEVQAAAVIVAQIQAQSFTDEQALNVQAIYPAWDGSGVNYPVGYKVSFGGILYKCLQAHVSQLDWMPDVTPSLWAKVLIQDENVIPDWEQPDSTNGYMTGDKVIHNGIIYQSLVDNNVWEPGATGTETLWKETA